MSTSVIVGLGLSVMPNARFSLLTDEINGLSKDTVFYDLKP
jgi:hypothetical protein